MFVTIAGWGMTAKSIIYLLFPAIPNRMILNAAFLVDRRAEKQFDERVKAISRQYEDLLTFKYTGPWPPYNFVNIKLKLEKAT